MTPKDMERKLFCEGCSIEAEVSREDRSMVRLISTSRGEQYKLLYRRNEHNALVISEVTKL